MVKNSTFKVLALGGGAQGSEELFSGDPSKIQDVIASGIVFSKDNPAYPISYKVADLKTREIARMAVSTDYIETNCRQYANGYVELKHEGAYIAKFSVSYKAHDSDNKVKTKS
ncbi:MAG: thiol-activated cytolysin family protein, partial [Rhodospirillales bacterium]|nr:thiol-activated cytolysin family protein [Rhodospirillales bacterium]